MITETVKCYLNMKKEEVNEVMRFSLYRIFAINLGAKKISRHQKGYMKQVPYGVPTNIQHHVAKFSRPCDLAHGSFTLLDIIHRQFRALSYTDLLLLLLVQ
jgi:hypothetical protein